MKKFGDLVKEQRISLGMSLREICLKNNINAEVLSKIERNLLLPIPPEMKRLIDVLKIFEGSVEHIEFLKSYENFTPEEEHITVPFFESDEKDRPLFSDSNSDEKIDLANFQVLWKSLNENSKL